MIARSPVNGRGTLLKRETEDSGTDIKCSVPCDTEGGKCEDGGMCVCNVGRTGSDCSKGKLCIYNYRQDVFLNVLTNTLHCHSPPCRGP